MATISMKFDKARIQALKRAAAGAARWDASSKVWRVPIGSLPAVRRALGEHDDTPMGRVRMWQSTTRGFPEVRFR